MMPVLRSGRTVLKGGYIRTSPARLKRPSLSRLPVKLTSPEPLSWKVPRLVTTAERVLPPPPSIKSVAPGWMSSTPPREPDCSRH